MLLAQSSQIPIVGDNLPALIFSVVLAIIIAGVFAVRAGIRALVRRQRPDSTDESASSISGVLVLLLSSWP